MAKLFTFILPLQHNLVLFVVHLSVYLLVITKKKKKPFNSFCILDTISERYPPHKNVQTNSEKNLEKNITRYYSRLHKKKIVSF